MSAVEKVAGRSANPRRDRVVSVLRRATIPVLLIATWLVVTRIGAIPTLFLPGPVDLYNSFLAMQSNLGAAMLSSVGMTLIGFLIGTSLGVMLGLLMAYSPVIRDLFGGVLDFVRPVPVFALIPLFVLWFGIGQLPQIILIAMGTSVILGVTTLDAIKNVSHVHIRAALTLGARRSTVYRTVIIPSIVPHLLGAVRVAAAASWGLDVAAEFIGAQNGLGYLMINRQQYLDTAGIVLIVIIYSLLALVLDFLLRRVEKPLTRWTERNATEGAAASIVGTR